jgi:uncharacterized protein YidB (DUF937 family)
MGILDDIQSQVTGGSSSEHAGLIGDVMGMLNDPQSGGLAGLMQSFKQKGLSDIVSSWVSTGANLPISVE